MKTPPLSLAVVAAASLVLSSCSTTDQYGATSQRIVVSPSNYRPMAVDGRQYYMHRGDYFVKRGDRYVSVRNPLSTVRAKRALSYNTYFDTLPAQRQTLRYRNRDYYVADGNYYRKRGATYAVVRNPIRSPW
ncbi:MAG: hypothetical protein P1U58_01405 [Verrucomicrobiales bacterium]|nr:hypothetical protein [Verrucomicrobiales bacterium]